MTRLFADHASLDAFLLAQRLATPEGSDQVESFDAKFGRPRDTWVDKLFPRYLEALGGRTGAAIDNLIRLTAPGLIEDASQRLAMRRLRDRLVQEHVEDMAALAAALHLARASVKPMLDVVERLRQDIQARWPGNAG